MAVSKAKRSIHLAQPQPQHAKTARAGGPNPERPRLNANQQPAEQMPVRAHAYRTIAQVNTGFEQLIEGLQTLQKINFLGSDSLQGMQNLICRIRAEANRELMTVLNEREGANAGHFQRLCVEPEREAA